MNLTAQQRQQIQADPAWRAIQVSMYRVCSELYFTAVEDVQFQSIIDDLTLISQRRAAFLEQFLHSHQGGR